MKLEKILCASFVLALGLVATGCAVDSTEPTDDPAQKDGSDESLKDGPSGDAAGSWTSRGNAAGPRILSNATAVEEPLPEQRTAPTKGPNRPLTAADLRDHYVVMLKPGSDARRLAASHGVTPRHVYTHAFNGFAGTLDAVQLRALSHHADVASIHPDAIASADTIQSPVTWGLDRIDQANLPLNNSYSYMRVGNGVRAYVIDTGILTTHTDFTGRALAMFDATGGNGQDCHGHGTHVAGTIGGEEYGVAKNVYLRGVRVFGACGSSGPWSDVIAGVDWVTANHIAPAVVNMSLGGAGYAPMDAAVQSLLNAGVFVSVSAGNSNVDACTQSPARVAGAFTMAASDSADARATFSNFGSCVDAYGPGVDVESDWASSTTATAVRDGTSMAAPHAAGIAALLCGGTPVVPCAPPDISGWLIGNSAFGKISGNPAGTPNRLINKM